MDGKYFWVLECEKGPRPFFATPDASWTWNKSDAYKFKEWDGASEFRHQHAQLMEYKIRLYDFSEDFKFRDEMEWRDEKQTEMRF